MLTEPGEVNPVWPEVVERIESHKGIEVTNLQFEFNSGSFNVLEQWEEAVTDLRGALSNFFMGFSEAIKSPSQQRNQ